MLTTNPRSIVHFLGSDNAGTEWGSYTHLSAILGERSVGKLSNLLSVHLSRTTVILRIGVISGTAMLAEKTHLCTKKTTVLAHANSWIKRLSFNGRTDAMHIYRVGKWRTNRIGISSNLHTSQLKPAPVVIQLCGSEKTIHLNSCLVINKWMWHCGPPQMTP